MCNSFNPENPELWEICMKHGTILAKREKVTQIAILDLYDAVLKLTAHNSDYVKCLESLKQIEALCDGNNPDHAEIWRIAYQHFA